MNLLPSHLFEHAVPAHIPKECVCPQSESVVLAVVTSTGWNLPNVYSSFDFVILLPETPQPTEEELEHLKASVKKSDFSGLLILMPPSLKDHGILRQLYDGEVPETPLCIAQAPTVSDDRVIIHKCFDMLRIALSQRDINEVLVDSLLFFPYKRHEQVVAMELQKHDLNELCYVVLVNIDDNTIPQEDDDRLIEHARSVIGAYDNSVMMARWGRILCCIFKMHNQPREIALAGLEEISQRIDAKIHVPFQLASGSQYPLSEIKNSFREAAAALNFGPVLRPVEYAPHVLSYNQMSTIQKLYNDMEDVSFLVHNAQKTLEPIVAYDMRHHTDLTTTLETFFDCDMSTTRTSEKMFLHKNTVRYRIEKCEELLNANFKEIYWISEIKIACDVIRAHSLREKKIISLE